MMDRIEWFSFNVSKINLLVQFLVYLTNYGSENFNCYLINARIKADMINIHVITTNDVQSKDNLINTLSPAVDTLVTVIKDNVDCLIKSF